MNLLIIIVVSSLIITIVKGDVNSEYVCDELEVNESKNKMSCFFLVPQDECVASGFTYFSHPNCDQACCPKDEVPVPSDCIEYNCAKKKGESCWISENDVFYEECDKGLICSFKLKEMK